MFRKIPYVSSELRVVDELPGMFGRPATPLRNFPVTPRENMMALYYEKHPFWMPVSNEGKMTNSALYSDNLGRGMGHDNRDSFGIEWAYIATVGGSIVRPGEPLLKDVNDWKEVIHFPDIDAWDWAGEAEKVKLDGRFPYQISLVNGFWFERLISFMDFAPAAMALIDEDQQDAVLELFQASTDFACRVIDKLCENYPMLDGFNIHDDWGAQKDTFFSPDVVREMIVPYMRKVTDFIHSKGKIADFHSCGKIEKQVPNMIAAGWDSWAGQPMNDTAKLYDMYGDKIIIGVYPDYDVDDSTPEQQREEARKYAARFCRKCLSSEEPAGPPSLFTGTSAPEPSTSPDISAMPCALSATGPNVSMATMTPTVVSRPVPARATANRLTVMLPPPRRNAA